MIRTLHDRPARPAPVSLRSPAMIAAALVAAACLVLSVSCRIYDPDLWQNLVVGKAIWLQHRVPTTHLWSWPTWGAPEVNWTWGFSALIWPLWTHGGVWGLFAWRWGTTLLAFALLWAAARAMGARGFAPLVVMVACGMIWRGRSQVRPETLVAVLLAAMVWILESRRHAGQDRAPWLVPLAWMWANAHNTYFLGLALIAIHLLDDLLARRPARRLAWAGLGAVAISFVNPFGWRALWQPFDFFLHHRNESIFRSIGELGPIDWSAQWRGLAVLFAAWPVLALFRMRRGRRDVVEALLCVMFSGVALGAQRFVGLYALVATPYVSRDLEEWSAGFRPMKAAPRAALTAAACVAIGLTAWLRPELPNGVGFLWNQYPVAACDFMEAHGVRGRGFNEFGFAGYQLYRFWPDRARLPFMDIHQSGTPRARELCAAVQEHDEAWRELDRTYAFDYALLARTNYEQNRPLDVLDADSTWALVFLDDVMALYVRRAGPLADVARSFGYRLLPAGAAKLVPLGEACTRDSSLRAQMVAELQREVAGSPYHAHAMIVLANIALFEGRSDAARDLLQRSIAVDPNRAGVHQSLATIALQEGRPRDALREVGLERRLAGGDPALDVLAGQAWWALGHAERARDAFRRALRRDPHHQEARAALEAVEQSRGR